MDDAEITRRLHELGRHEVPGDVATGHLRRMAAASPTTAGPRFGRVAVATAAVVGFVFGSTGLAVAGALPDPAQDVAHDVLASVSIQVPEGKANRGACVSAIATSAEIPEEEKKAHKDACPKGGPPHGDAPGRSGEAPGQVKHADDPCRGRPPWAGDKTRSPEERAAMQAEREACPDEPDEPEETEAETELEGEAPGAGG